MSRVTAAGRPALLLAPLLLGGCWVLVGGAMLRSGSTAGGTLVHDDPIVGLSIRGNIGAHHPRLTDREGNAGEPGDLNPAVVQYLLVAEGSLADYYEVALTMKAPPPRVHGELRALAEGAHRDLPAGVLATGRDYARALARRAAEHVVQALGIPGDFGGSAQVTAGALVDPERQAFKTRLEVGDDSTEIRIALYRYERAQLVTVLSTARDELLAFDLSGVPAAFDSTRALSYYHVAATIRPLHPATRAEEGR